MSGGHEHGGDHGHEAHGSNSTGKTIDLGITSMIAGFFGMASGAGAMKEYMDGKGGGGHDHH